MCVVPGGIGVRGSFNTTLSGDSNVGMSFTFNMVMIGINLAVGVFVSMIPSVRWISSFRSLIHEEATQVVDDLQQSSRGRSRTRSSAEPFRPIDDGTLGPSYLDWDRYGGNEHQSGQSTDDLQRSRGRPTVENAAATLRPFDVSNNNSSSTINPLYADMEALPVVSRSIEVSKNRVGGDNV